MSKKHMKGNGGEVPENSEMSGSEDLVAVEAGEPDCRELLARKEEELKQSQDRVLRMAAELDNTRKRLEREKSEGIAYANEGLMKDLLPVLDNLERALEHSENEADCGSLVEGVRMTLKGFLDSLARFGCAPFESVGNAFDPNFHEAVMQEEVADYPERTVIREFQKGYTLKERLLRPAMVVVSKAAGDT
ncbi:MAG TPA: nucleotide exchange factor GrpE [Syntrophobacter fumaroxidans]|nr:nucleotide exchange factor GrpE [Syntrophobacter fumaroxidans]